MRMRRRSSSRVAAGEDPIGEAVGEDPAVAVLGEAVVGEVMGEDPAVAALGEAEVGEVIGEDLAVDPTVVDEEREVQAWRRSRSGHTSGGKIIAMVRVLGWVASHLKEE
jgi:hypothetical protein